MMRDYLKRGMALILVLALLFCMNVSAHAAAGRALIYYNSAELGPNVTAALQTILDNLGYTTVRYGNPPVSTLKSVFASTTKILYVSTHGSPGSLQCSDGSLKANQITDAPSKFVYLAACHSGETGTNGSFKLRMQELGTDASITFAGEISASSQTNGIHEITQRTFVNLSQGMTVRNAFETARAVVYNATGKYYGSNLVNFTGGTVTIN